MELNFLGCGAAFNPKLGNNSAYFIEDNELFLIDCGEAVFGTIKDMLDGIKKVNVIITHTHADHIGSLPTLGLYCTHILNIPLNIIIGKKCKHKKSIDSILKLMGFDDFEFVLDTEFDNKYKSFDSIRFIETVHCSNLDCYSLIFRTNRGVVYYSSDTKELNTLGKLFDDNLKIDKMYIDTSSDIENGAHVYIGDLNKVVPYNYRNKVYCMHYNDDTVIEMAERFGFNIIKNRN